MDDKTLWQLIGRLSLDEKAALCSGADYWTTKPLPKKGIPSLRMADGPNGLRYEDPAKAEENGGNSRKATCFPPECSLACSFSPQLAARVGAAIAEEALENRVGLVLGPGVNIKRSPLCGRNFEYYSEDPLLSGEMAAGFITGLQEKGVGASLKHFAVNNQESERMSINAAVDERALFEIYLKAFEIAVKKAKPATVMCSYNRLLGTYASENRRLLTDILRLRFGFTGAVISDWGAVYRRSAGVAAGLDLEMPASGGYNDAAVAAAVRRGELSEDALDAACLNILQLVFAYEKESAPAFSSHYGQHHELAAEVLCKSAVLLKNEGLLPLPEGEEIAVIGEMAQQPRYQGGGSANINPQNLVSFTKALDRACLPYLYTPGYRGNETNDALLLNAVAAAKKAKNVVLFLGLPDLFECEGYDRQHLRLPDCQLRLLDAVAAANPKVTVVLSCGSPVEMPWLDKVKSILCLYLGGEAVGEATLHLLFGRANPSGKLAESWPLALSDTPCYHHYPMGPEEVSYNESLYVGYRYYNTAKIPVLFPFGHGLSYTQFQYGALSLSAQKLAAGESLTLRFTLKNTGDMAGEEICQVYAAAKESHLFRPAQELVGFTRVLLAPGEERTVEIPLPYETFSIHDPASGSSVVEEGLYELAVGASSLQLPQRAELHLVGVELSPAAPWAATGPYGTIQDNRFPDENFAQLYGKSLSKNLPPRPGQYTPITTLGQLKGNFWGRKLLSLATAVAKHTTHFGTTPEVNRLAATKMAEDLPLKNLPLMTEGRVSPDVTAALLSLCNGKGSPFGVLHALGKKMPKKQK